MDSLTPEQKAASAICHILERIQTDPFVGYYCGLGTQSFALLTEALASLLPQTKTVRQIREEYAPRNPENPREANEHGGQIFGENGPLRLERVREEFVMAMDHQLSRENRWHSWQPDRLTCVEELSQAARALKQAIKYRDPFAVRRRAAALADTAMKIDEVLGEDEP